MILNLYKNRGETPLECLQNFARKNGIKDKMTYLGRLDPLAEGVLLVATGDDIKRKKEFLDLDKEYEFSVIFGFATDTYDILGRVVKSEKVEKISETDLLKVASIYEGDREQKYPEYSSKMIAKRKTSPRSASQNDPLLEAVEGGNAALPLRLGEGRLAEGKRDEVKKITVYKTQFHKLEIFSAKELFGRILADISKVKGNFRQVEILEAWRKILLNHSYSPSPSKGEVGVRSDKYFIAKFSAHVSSGTYIRSLVNDMGATLGFGATTLSIKRTCVGDYKIGDSQKIV